MSWDPETGPLSSDAHEVWWRHLHPKRESLNATSSDFLQATGHFVELRKFCKFCMPKRGKLCLFTQITPTTTDNHLPFAYYSFTAHTYTGTLLSTTYAAYTLIKYVILQNTRAFLIIHARVNPSRYFIRSYHTNRKWF